MKSAKPQTKRKIDNTLAEQFVVQWKTLLGFIVIVVLIAISLSATARAHKAANDEETEPTLLNLTKGTESVGETSVSLKT